MAFAIWGINDVFKPIRATDVASGKGFRISQQEFALAFDNELKSVQQQANRPVTKQEAVAANYHMKVLDRLVQQRVFDGLAKRVGVSTSNAMVAQDIQANPAFRSQVTGAFDKTTYQTLLARNGISRQLYEDDLRGGMTREQLARALVAGVRPPSSFGRIILAFESEKRTSLITAITPDKPGPPPTPTDADLQTFYQAQSRAFALPEYRAFTLITADPAAFEPRVEVPEEKIKELFEFRKAQLTTPEKRTFVVVSGGDQAKAQEAARRLAAGEDAEAIARSLGMQAIHFDKKAKADAPDPKIGEAVFALQAGKTTAPIQGITWSAARVSEIVPGVTPTLEEARPQLRAELARDEAQDLMNTAVEKFEDARAGGADFEASATQAGLAVSKTPLVDARGLGVNGQPEPSVLDQPDLLKAVFETQEGDPSDWISGAEGASTMIRIDTVKPSGAPPLAQVRDRVAAAWRSEKIAAGMTAIADRIAAAVKAGKSFTDAAHAEHLPIVATEVLDRRSAQNTPSPRLAAAIFNARAGDVVTGPGGPRGQVLFVAQVQKIERADPSADPQGVEQRRQVIVRGLESDILEAVQNTARANARVHLNQPLIDNVVGKTEPEAGS
jgi:peptidyl-prolyl cis-trans isomerase D